MKTVQDYLDLGLVFVDGDKIFGVTGDSSSHELDIFDRTICAKKYSKGAAKIGVDCYARARWTPSSFAWRNKGGVKPDYNGLIHATFENGTIIQDFADSLNLGSSFNPIIQWRPVVSMCNHTELKPRLSFVSAISIDVQKFWNKSIKTINCPCAAVNIEAIKPTVSPKEDKPMKPVYTAEMHSKGELPPVGSEFYPIENEKDTQTCLGYTSKGDVVGECFGGGVVSLFFVNEIKPIIKTIKVNGFDVPAPMSESPEVGTEYFVPSINSDDFVDDYTFRWDSYDNRWLSRGVAHSTKSAAIAHAKAMLGINPNPTRGGDGYDRNVLGQNNEGDEL